MQKEYFNVNDLQKIIEILKPKSIFLVTGKSSYESSGAKKKVEIILKRYKVTFFNEFTTNPKIEDIKKGVKILKRENSDLVIAVGGGSVIDIAKSINIFAAHKNEPELYIRKHLPLSNGGKNLIAIPTTSGTGSEATHFAVVYINKNKKSIAHKKFLIPDYVILDHTLTLTLPKKITANTGIDAFCQAIEAYWSLQTNQEAQIYAEKAISLILENLEVAVNNPTIQSRKLLMKAANLAGKAINIAKTTACHAISYPITSYFNVPHGHAVALTLPEIFIFNTELNEGPNKENMNNLMRIIKANNPLEAKKKIESLIDSIGLERNLSKLNITKERDIDIIVNNGFNPERMKNNPRRLTKDQLRLILKKIF